MRGPISSCLCQHLVLSDLKPFAYMWNLIVVLICIHLSHNNAFFHIINDNFDCLFLKYLSKSFVHFSFELFVFYLMILKYSLHVVFNQI